MSNWIASIKTQHLYFTMLIIQVLVLCNGLVLSKLLEDNLIQIPPLIQAVLQFTVIIAANVTIFTLVRRFVENNYIYYFFALSVVLSIGFMFVSESPANTSLCKLTKFIRSEKSAL